MTDKVPEHDQDDLGRAGLLRLLAADRKTLGRLQAGETLKATTPLLYPGRFGPVVVHLAPGEPSDDPAAARPVKISDGGDLLKSLDEQGMDLAVDMILSKTVFHAIKEVEGANLAGGLVYIDSDAGRAPADVWRLLQLIAEIIGLRHSKYKDALVRLSRRQEGPDLIDWSER